MQQLEHLWGMCFYHCRNYCSRENAFGTDFKGIFNLCSAICYIWNYLAAGINRTYNNGTNG